MQELGPSSGTLDVQLLVVGHKGLAPLVPTVQLRLILGQLHLVASHNAFVRGEKGEVGDGHVIGSGDKTGSLDEVAEPAEGFVEASKCVIRDSLCRSEENGNLKVFI